MAGGSIKKCIHYDRAKFVRIVFKANDIGAGGHGIDYPASQIGRCGLQLVTAAMFLR